MLKSFSMIALSVPTIALGAALLLTGTGSAGAQEGLFTSERDCTTDVSSLCAGVKQCAGDIHQFCPTATFGSVGDCMKPHLAEASGTCKAAMAFMASPAADRY
jgi:hypothetical protein